MKYETDSVCYIVAGPNGAGKTTYALRYLPAIAACRNFLNADEIARGLSPLDYNTGLLQASRVFITQLEQKIRDKKSFAFETTLSGRHYLAQIPLWQSQGWKIVLIYLYIPGPEFSETRVLHRMKQGGHFVPQEDIYRRYPRSLKNLFDYMNVCDETYCVDNSASLPLPIFEKRKGSPVSVDNEILYQQIKEYFPHE